MANPTKSYTPGTFPTIPSQNSGRLFLSNQLVQISQLVNATQQQVTSAQSDIAALQSAITATQTLQTVDQTNIAALQNPPIGTWTPVVAIDPGQPGALTHLDTGSGVYIDVGPFRFVNFYSGSFSSTAVTYVMVNLPSNYSGWPAMAAVEEQHTGASCTAQAWSNPNLLFRTGSGTTPVTAAGTAYGFYVSGFYTRA